ncbi:MAG TPA: ABC transporter ATP-binding protein [Anaeromyxobacteraceae bacterium]|nr:ABC transporter ATP-binding protein [Anaeromyxobacteraceae bacterium]
MSVTAESARDGAGGAPARLAADGLRFAYGDRTALDGVSFSIAPGEVFGFLGPNGAGKSTLFAILAGLLAPSSGRIWLDGRPLDAASRALRARMGVVFQEPSLDAKLTAEENLRLGAALFRVPRAEARLRVAELLAAAGLSDRARDPAGKLSGGMRRRLEIARALVHRPDVLLLDEPTTGLDALSFRRTWEALRGSAGPGGATVVLTTHRPDEAAHCDRLAILSRGRVVAVETPASLLTRVAGDVVVVEADEAAALAAEIGQRLGLRARVAGDVVSIERERGHELVPRLVESFPAGRFRSVSVRRPGLADAFLHVAGEDLAEEARP